MPASGKEVLNRKAITDPPRPEEGSRWGLVSGTKKLAKGEKKTLYAGKKKQKEATGEALSWTRRGGKVTPIFGH